MEQAGLDDELAMEASESRVSMALESPSIVLRS
jgi:hypothetical protein